MTDDSTNDDLRELVEQFRERAEFAEKAANNDVAAEMARQNADELEALLEDD